MKSNLWLSIEKCKDIALTVINSVVASQDTVSCVYIRNIYKKLRSSFWKSFRLLNIFNFSVREKVVVDEFRKEGSFAHDDSNLHMLVSPKSVMCTPIVHLNKFIGNPSLWLRTAKLCIITKKTISLFSIYTTQPRMRLLGASSCDRSIQSRETLADVDDLLSDGNLTDQRISLRRTS